MISQFRPGAVIAVTHVGVVSTDLTSFWSSFFERVHPAVSTPYPLLVIGGVSFQLTLAARTDRSSAALVDKLA